MDDPDSAKTLTWRDGDILVVRIPMSIKRQGSRKKIIASSDAGGAKKVIAEPQEALVVALARGHHWRDLIESGKYGGLKALAQALDVDRSYVGRMIKLTLLAPDIIEAIIRGREPSGLSLARLLEVCSIRWSEQREAVGCCP